MFLWIPSVPHYNSSKQVQVLTFFYSFHLSCLEADRTCLVYDPPLKSQEKQLSENLNKALVNEIKEKTGEITAHDKDNSRHLGPVIQSLIH